MKNLIIIITLVVFAMFTYTGASSVASETSSPYAITKVRASHILVDTKEEADIIKARLDEGEGFVTLAKRYSKCPSGENGGDLGYFEHGQMVKEFEDVAFALPVGKVSKPVHTQFGWHIIRVTDKK